MWMLQKGKCSTINYRKENGVQLITERKMEGRKEIFNLTTHSTHFIYSYMASDIW